jgi:hypothetical protein
MSRAVPVAEGTEADTPGSCASAAYADYSSQQQQQQAQQQVPQVAKSSEQPNWAGSSNRHSVNFDSIPQMMQLARTLLMAQGGAAVSAAADSSGSLPLPASQQQHAAAAAAAAAAVYAGAAGDWEEPDAAITEDYSEVLDLTDFMGCFSPVGGSRQLSRVASRNAAAAAAAASPGALMRSSTRAGSLQGSPRVTSSSIPDMAAFWADSYSVDASRAPSRQLSSAAQRSPACNNPSYLTPQQHAEQGPAAAGGVTGAAAKALATPSPSRKAMLLHGPSRLSWKSPAVASELDISTCATAGGGAEAQAGIAAAVAAVAVGGCDNEGGDEATSQQQQENPAVLEPLAECEDAPEPQQQQQVSTAEEAQREQQQQQQQGKSKPLLKRMLFGRKGPGSSSGSSNQLQQPLMQEFMPLQSAAARLQQQQQQGEEHEQSPVKKHLGFFSFLQRSKSPSKDGSRQLGTAGAAAAGEGTSSCPVTPVSGGGNALAVGQQTAVSSCPSSPVGIVSADASQQMVPGPLAAAVAAAPAESGVAAHARAAPINNARWMQHEQQQQQQQQQYLADVNRIQQPDSPPAAITAAAAAAVAAATAAAASPGSPAMDVLASSMQRIAGCLEEFLCERSPARNSPAHQQLRQSPSMRNSSDAAAAAASAAVPPAMHVSQQAADSNDTSKSASGAFAAASGLLQKAPWSPAAHAAKARMLASSARSPARLATAETRYQQQQPQGASTVPQEPPQQQQLLEPINRRDGTAELGVARAAAAAGATGADGDTAAAGWLHPSSVQNTPAAAASADAPSAQHNEQHVEVASSAAEAIAAAPASPSNPASLQALASRAAGSTVLGRGAAAAIDSKHARQQHQQQQGVVAGWQAEPSLVDMPGSPSSPRPQGSPNQAMQQQRQGSPGRTYQQQKHLVSAALHTVNVQPGGVPAAQQQSQHRMRKWHLDDLSCSDADDEWQEDAEQEQISFPVQLPSLHHAALQLGLPPGSMQHRAAGGMHSSKGGASARCIVAAADVKLLQAERGEQRRVAVRLAPCVGWRAPHEQQLRQYCCSCVVCMTVNTTSAQFDTVRRYCASNSCASYAA